MPRFARKKIRCAFALEELPKLPKPRKPRAVLTDEEKAMRKLDRELKAQEREKKKELKQKRLDWEAKLPVGGNSYLRDDIKVMFYSDAKKHFALSDRELESLSFWRYRNSSKRVIPLSELLAHANKRVADIGVSCPAIDLYDGEESSIPNVMTKTTDYLGGLYGRRAKFRW